MASRIAQGNIKPLVVQLMQNAAATTKTQGISTSAILALIKNVAVAPAIAGKGQQAHIDTVNTSTREMLESVMQHGGKQAEVQINLLAKARDMVVSRAMGESIDTEKTVHNKDLAVYAKSINLLQTKVDNAIQRMHTNNGRYSPNADELKRFEENFTALRNKLDIIEHKANMTTYDHNTKKGKLLNVLHGKLDKLEAKLSNEYSGFTKDLRVKAQRQAKHEKDALRKLEDQKYHKEQNKEAARTGRHSLIYNGGFVH